MTKKAVTAPRRAPAPLWLLFVLTGIGALAVGILFASAARAQPMRWPVAVASASGSTSATTSSAPSSAPALPVGIATNGSVGGAAPSSAHSSAPALPAKPPGPFALPKDFPEKPRFVVVELHEEVNLGMAAFIERVAAELRKDDILVLDIKTFGGRVDAAVTIRDALLHTHDVGARTVAYINPRAISAGALISYAADVIVVAPGATMGAATPVQVGSDQEAKPVSEKVVSYMRKEMRATAEARGRNGDVAEAMVDTDIEVDGVVDRGKLLTLDGKQALSWGVASFEADSFDGVVKGLGYELGEVEVQRVAWSWGEDVAGWLSNPVIAGLLMSIGMLALMIGLYSGGNHVAIGVGVSCLALFFFGHHVVNLAGIEDIILFVIGIILIAVEVYAPGHIIPGALGVLCVTASLVLGLIDFGKVDFSVQWAAGYITTALATVFGAVLLTAVTSWGAVRLLPHSALGRRLLLVASIDGRVTDKHQVQHAELVGSHGVAVTDLHPGGKVKIDGKRMDAKAEHGFIAAGATVKVVESTEFELIVASVDPEAEEAT